MYNRAQVQSKKPTANFLNLSCLYQFLTFETLFITLQTLPLHVCLVSSLNEKSVQTFNSKVK